MDGVRNLASGGEKPLSRQLALIASNPVPSHQANHLQSRPIKSSRVTLSRVKSNHVTSRQIMSKSCHVTSRHVKASGGPVPERLSPRKLSIHTDGSRRTARSPSYSTAPPVRRRGRGILGSGRCLGLLQCRLHSTTRADVRRRQSQEARPRCSRSFGRGRGTHRRSRGCRPIHGRRRGAAAG